MNGRPPWGIDKWKDFFCALKTYMNPSLVYAGTATCVRTSLYMQDELAKLYKEIFLWKLVQS